MVLEQESLIGKGGKFMFQVVLLVKCICNVNIEVEVDKELTRKIPTLTLVRCFKVNERP